MAIDSLFGSFNTVSVVGEVKRQGTHSFQSELSQIHRPVSGIYPASR